MHVMFVESGYSLYQSVPGGRARGRAILVLGYSATPDTYDESHDDFARFREALVLGPPAPNGYQLH
jgi:hypothetical protein